MSSAGIAFVFCERASGAIRFQVSAGPDGEMPIEEAASLLAMHCLVRSQTPEDYAVLIVPREPLLDAVSERAEQLLNAGRSAAGSHVQLSTRQREVLHCVLRDLSNKEIGNKLHVTERTVKFHVSGLLAKFNVRDRFGLKREAAVGLLPTTSSPGSTLFGFEVSPPSDKGEETDAHSGRLQRMPRVLRTLAGQTT
jgi:DNA-binding CsgD family transcriptional regulator